MDDELLPWGTLQCAGKLAGHRLLDWSFYALILVFPVIWYFLFGSWFKSQLGSLVSAAKGSYRDIFWNWKNCHDGDQYFPVWNTMSIFCGTHQLWNKCHISGYFLDLKKLPQ